MSDDIQDRLRKLEEENRKLRAQVGGTQPAVKPTTTYVDLWEGKPILRFDGNFKPFGIGWKKAAVILECVEDFR